MNPATVIENIDSSLRAPRLDLGDIIHAPKSKPGNPNVEALCVALTDIPTSLEAFKEMSKPNGKEFGIVRLGLLQVGRPGFSTAPYKSGKPDAGITTEPLYTINEQGQTVFRPWNKVSNNKDRGPVSDNAELFSSAPVGSVLTHFLWEEAYTNTSSLFVQGSDSDPHRYADSVDTIVAGSFVVVELKACNADQAVKGSLIKLSRMLPLHPKYLSWGLLQKLPCRLDDVGAIRGVLQSPQFSAVSKNLSVGNTSLLKMAITKDYFCSYDERGFFVLCNETNSSRVRIHEDRVFAMLGSREVDKCNRMMDVLAACSAAHLLIETEDKQEPFSEECTNALAVLPDERQLLSIEALSALCLDREVNGEGNNNVIHESETSMLAECAEMGRDGIVWHYGQTMPTKNGASCAFAFAIGLGEDNADSEEQTETSPKPGLLSLVRPAGRHYEVRVIATKTPADFVSANGTLVPLSETREMLTFYCAPQEMGTASQKRKRVSWFD